MKTRDEAIRDLEGNDGKHILAENYKISEIDKRIMKLNHMIRLEKNIDKKLELINEVSKWKV